MFGIKFKPQAQIILLVMMVVSLALYFVGKRIPQDQIEAFIVNFGVMAPIAYIISHQLSYVLAPISGLPFLIIGFFLFNKTVILYIYLASLLGFTINFWIARIWGRPILSKFVEKGSIEKIDKLSREHGIVTLIALRLLQGGLGDYVSYAYGLTNIRFSFYFIISALSAIPGIVLWYIIIAKTNSIEKLVVTNWVLVIAASIIFFTGNILAKRYKKFFNSWFIKSR